MKVVVISSPVPVQAEAQLLDELFRAGMETFHLRKPHFSLAEVEKFISQLRPDYHQRIVLHLSRGQELSTMLTLLRDYGLKGLHCSRVRAAPVIPKISSSTFSTSFHSLQEIRESAFEYNYALLSPVFDSISKPAYKTSLKPEDLRENSHLLQSKNIYALGGVDADKIEILAGIGFTGLGILGAIWQHQRPLEQFEKIQLQCRQLAPVY